MQTARACVWAVTQLTGAFCRLRRKGTGSPAPPQRGAPPEQGAAPTGAADSLPPAGAERGAESSPNCVKAAFCAPLRGLQLALFGGCDRALPRPAAARCLPAETGELRQMTTFTPPLRGFTVRAGLSCDRADRTGLKLNAARQHSCTDQRASVRRSVATRGARQPFFFLSAQCADTPRPCAGLAETLVSIYT